MNSFNCRKTLSFWNSKLKKVVRPSLQKPLEPTKPDPPVKHNDGNPSCLPNLVELYQHELLADVIFLCKVSLCDSSQINFFVSVGYC